MDGVKVFLLIIFSQILPIVYGGLVLFALIKIVLGSRLASVNV